MKVAELFNEGLKDFGQKLLNKAVGVPSGEHKYKVGDTVKFEMIPGQEGGSDTGKIEKLLKGHHYLINGKPVNQNEIKSKVTEAKKPKSLEQMKKRRSEILDKMDRIVQDGGRIPLNDPLSVELKQLKRDIAAAKKLTEAFAMDDIAVVSDPEHAKTNGGGGTVIYKTSQGYYKISKVRKKREPYTLLLWNGDTITNDAVVSTDYSDWKDYKDKKIQEERVDELKLGTLASYRQKRLQQRQEIMSKEPYAVPKGPKDPLSQKVHSGITRAYYKGLAKKAEEENERDPDRNSIQRQYYSGKSGSYTGD